MVLSDRVEALGLEAWLALLERRHPLAIELGLERCRSVYRQMGSPRPAKRVFTVAGTNGKGSTVSYLAALTGALDQRYGTYMSPHIFRFNERISIMGEPVSDECLIAAFKQVEAARGEISLTYFEFTTLAGLLILHQAELDCAILEVGLGGRLDTVNLVDTDCAIITPIGLDHQEFLGPDLNSIAAEKAGIIRPGVPVVCTEANPPEPVLTVADNLQAHVYRRGSDFELSPDPDVSLLQFSMARQLLTVPQPSMAGTHQSDNLAAALAALALIYPDWINRGSQISTAINNCKVIGRLQRVCSSPEVILDVGHNELAAKAVAVFLKDSKRTNTTCVLGMLADKSAEAVALALGDVCNRWLCADSPGPRGQSGELLAGRVKKTLPGADVNYFGPVSEALQNAVSSVNENETILVLGSFLTISAAANWLKNYTEHRRHDAARIT